jgi:hypothetical protein
VSRTTLPPLNVTEPRVRGSGLLFLVAALVVVASVAGTVADGVVEPTVALTFGAFIAVGEFLRLRLPGDREAAPLGAAGSLAFGP